MKKILVSLLMVFGFVFTSLGSAQSDGFGIYSGYPDFLGVQYQASNLRFGVGLAVLGIGGGIDLLLGENQLNTGSSDLQLSWYYGAGVSASVWAFYSLGGFVIFPHGLAGIEWQLPQSTISVYGELQLGFNIGLSGATSGLGFVSRVGAIFR